MAYVITAVGAGGKTGYLMRRGREYAALGKTVAFTTTTHIFRPERESAGGIRFFGADAGDGKLSYPGDACFEELCRAFDVVLVEGDGSKGMPVKYPGEHEPVIPDCSDEVDVIMGLHAAGRPLSEVCHRFSGEDRIVTEELLREIAEDRYITPVKKRLPGAFVRYVPSDLFSSGLEKDVKRISIVLLASGFGKRFGANKLLCPFGGKPLFRRMLDALINAAGRLTVPSEILAVTQYDEIARAAEEAPQGPRFSVRPVMNPDAAEGISASVRLGAREAVLSGSDAVSFFAADMPFLPADDIVSFLEEFRFSGKTCACMASGGMLSNPAAFRLSRGIPEAIQGLSGDRGAIGIIRARLPELHRYWIGAGKLADIDVPGAPGPSGPEEATA